MKRIYKVSAKILAFLLALALLMPFSLITKADTGNEYEGKIVILHSNDVHGAIDGYPVIKELANQIKSQGGEVILVDAGDFAQGNVYTFFDEGNSIIDLMNLVGYDVVTVGNHEFDYGIERMQEIMNGLSAKTISINILKDGLQVFDSSVVLEVGGMKIGFIGIETPEALTKSNPAKNPGLCVINGNDLFAAVNSEINSLKNDEVDLIIGVTHLGVDDASYPSRSEDLWANTTGMDFIIDAHSHTVMTEGANGEPIQSTGTKFANIGVIEIDKKEKTITKNYLYQVTKDSPKDQKVQEKVQEINEKVNKEYATVIGKTDFDLNGEKDPGNRTEETNLGNLLTDSFIWYLTEQNPGSIEEGIPIVAIENGGGIRNWIYKGEIKKRNVFDVLPFGNTLTVVYVSGSELLEALEASTYSTPGALGGFPQISGMNIKIKTYEKYDAGEKYPGSTYCKPKSIRRVEITSVNGQPFDPEGRYAVLTNDFVASGGDTYYAFKAASKKFDTGFAVDEILSDYIKTALNGEVSADYEKPQGRISIIKENPQPKPDPQPVPLTDDSDNVVIWLIIMVISSSVIAGAGIIHKNS